MGFKFIWSHCSSLRRDTVRLHLICGAFSRQQELRPVLLQPPWSLGKRGRAELADYTLIRECGWWSPPETAWIPCFLSAEQSQRVQWNPLRPRAEIPSGMQAIVLTQKSRGVHLPVQRLWILSAVCTLWPFLLFNSGTSISHPATNSHT